MPAVRVCLHTPPTTNSTEIQQGLPEVSTQAENKLAAAAAALFSKWWCLEWGQLFSLDWKTPIASPGKSVQGPGEQDWFVCLASSRMPPGLIASG